MLDGPYVLVYKLATKVLLCKGLGPRVAPASIVADVSAIHRGMPIAAGTRYALTNYFFQTKNIDVSLFEKFNVIPSTS